MSTITRDDTRLTASLWHAIASGHAGHTVDALDTEVPTHGYYVGGASNVLVIDADSITPDDVAGYVSTHPETRYFGMWVDGGSIYIDSVDHVTDAFQAHYMGVEREEISVFNIATGECEQS